MNYGRRGEVLWGDCSGGRTSLRHKCWSNLRRDGGLLQGGSFAIAEEHDHISEVSGSIHIGGRWCPRTIGGIFQAGNYPRWCPWTIYDTFGGIIHAGACARGRYPRWCPWTGDDWGRWWCPRTSGASGGRSGTTFCGCHGGDARVAVRRSVRTKETGKKYAQKMFGSFSGAVLTRR